MFGNKNLRRRLGLLLVLSCVACGDTRDRPDFARAESDLLQAARRQGIRGPSGQNVFLYSFPRGGIRREALILIPGAVFEVAPRDLSAGPLVRLWMGMPFQLGDGGEARVEATVAGVSREILRQAMDPIHRREDRQWRRLEFVIPAGAVGVRFTAWPGPAGDSTADWIGLAPRREGEP